MTHASVPAGDLARLLETERRLGERLRSARSEAEALVAQARADVAQREAALDAELEGDERRVTERLARDRRKREREIADEAERQVAAFAAVSAQRVRAVVRTLTQRLLDDESAP